jgi:hypothetical protein
METNTPISDLGGMLINATALNLCRDAEELKNSIELVQKVSPVQFDTATLLAKIDSVITDLKFIEEHTRR